MADIPEKPSIEGLEQKWGERWEADGTYRFDRTKSRDQIYSVDTPPPTVSGHLHIGHVMSYTHTDLIVRFQRMRGKEIFYPMGWDDNGLPTERRVQNYYGVRCDPSLPYDRDFQPPAEPPKDPIAISRPNFVELCSRLTLEDEKVMEDVWRTLGLSVDWTQTYSTIDERSRRASQLSFLRLLESAMVYQTEAPTYWDIDFQSAIAQAELEDRETSGALHKIRFGGIDGDDVFIETSRPELIPSCVALVANPDDDRYRDRFETFVQTPLFDARVPIKAHPLADPETGTGIAMICTFGDVTDVQWWRELSLPVRSVMQPNGRFGAVTWGQDGWDSEQPARAQANYDKLAGLTVRQAQRKMVELLEESGDLVEKPKAITHTVKFFEKGDRPLEIISSRQWYVKVLDFKEDFIRRGREINWHPDFMRLRFEDWVNGLNVDWGVSRQRYYGVPFPLWYPVSSDGEIDYDSPITAAEDKLPIDPSTDSPPGYSPEQRGVPGGFVGDPDVMDTWATSALTPQIAGGWGDDDDLFGRVFPMDLRSQAHDIIRTWTFVTIVRAHFGHDSIPWSNAAISGFITDPDRKKMSKSKGNVITPMEVLIAQGADSVRYWATKGRPGVDLTFDESVMKVGRRLAIKILNASKFVMSRLGAVGDVTEPLDKAFLAKLADVVDVATSAFEEYDYTKAMERTEEVFWDFTDDYLELVKSRSYREEDDAGSISASAALSISLDVFLRLFAPFMPYVTEEVWSWWKQGSVHLQSWPSPDELRAQSGGTDPNIVDVASSVLAEIRKAKTTAQVSLKTEVSSLVVQDTADRLQLLRLAEDDLRAAGRVVDLQLTESDNFSVQVTLAG